MTVMKPSELADELEEAIEVHEGHNKEYVSFDLELGRRILAALRTPTIEAPVTDGLVEEPVVIIHAARCGMHGDCPTCQSAKVMNDNMLDELRREVSRLEAEKAALVEAFLRTQAMLETNARTDSVNWDELREQVMANRALLTRYRGEGK